MKWISRSLKLLVVIFVGAVLCFFLPSRDIVHISGVEVSREDYKKIDQTTTGQNRDVRYISAEWPNEKPRAYRNEDAPLYLKFDSGNLNAQAHSLEKQYSKENPRWVVVKHYGWRIPFLSMYPNVLTIKNVDGPHVRMIPWFNIIFLTALAIIVLRTWLWMRGLKRKHVDPIADKVEDVTDAAQEEMAEKKAGISRFFRRWFGSSK
jgi:hypothetical protein